MLKKEYGRINQKISLLREDEKAKAGQALRIMSGFDGDMNKESSPGALAGAFYHFFTRNTFLDELGPEEGPLWKSFLATNERSYAAPQDHLLVRFDSPFFDNIHTVIKEDRYDILALSLLQAYEFCEDKMGKEAASWKWSDIMKIHWIHDLSHDIPFSGYYFNRGPFEYAGDSHTVNVSVFNWGSSFVIEALPSMRMIVDFSRENPLYLTNHTGQSENPASRHYDDMQQLWLKGQLNPVPFSKAAVDKKYIHQVLMTPPVMSHQVK